jgi:cholesterol transport system auxiliary component
VKPTRALAAIAAATLSLALGGCISVFPKATPAQLFAFGTDFPAAQAPQTGAQPFNVMRSATAFAQQAAGDRILTTNGQQGAYIAANRWISPAVVLFDQAETRAFDANPGPARLTRRGEISGAAAELRLEVQTFEARYPGSLKASPTVVVQVRAVLIRLSDRQVVDTKIFVSRQAIGDNRVSEIVRGFDVATVDVLGQIVAWTDSEAAAITSPS